MKTTNNIAAAKRKPYCTPKTTTQELYSEGDFLQSSGGELKTYELVYAYFEDAHIDQDKLLIEEWE